MRKRKGVALLPERLLGEIESIHYSDLLKSRAIKACNLIMNRLADKGKAFDEYVSMPCKYWKKALGEHYERAIIPLVNNRIIERIDFYSKSSHVCKKYRINPELLSENFLTVQYVSETFEKNAAYVCKQTRSVLRSLHLDLKGARAYVEEYISTGGYLGRVKFDGEVMESGNLKVLMRGKRAKKWKEYHYSKERALEVAQQSYSSLIQDNHKIVVEQKDKFLLNKRMQIRFHYNGGLIRFRNKEFYAEITETNGRLNSNITTMPSRLVPFFTLEGERLNALDLSNSQFVFLAAMIVGGKFDKYLEPVIKKLLKEEKIVLKKNAAGTLKEHKEGKGKGNKEKRNKQVRACMCANDVEVAGMVSSLSTSFPIDLQLFLVLAKKGKLYEYIQDKLVLNFDTGRNDAKKMMFEIFFSKRIARSPAKKRMKEVFPTLIEMIDLFKKENGDNQFAIALQRQESEIFIGKILPELFQQGFKVLTKHDSVLCKESDLHRVEKIMRGILDRELVEYQLKTECHSEEGVSTNSLRI